MPTIIHDTDDGRSLAKASAALLFSGRLLILAGPQDAVPHEQGGMIDGQVMRLTYLAAVPSAFRVLADCARLLRRIDAASADPLDYRQASAPEAVLDETADVAWHTQPGGSVTAFRLSAAAAGDPLLPILTDELASQPLTDDRRFAFLATALAGA